ncbi:MAG: RIP metalloprotease RseP [Bacteroidota bacterium]
MEVLVKIAQLLLSLSILVVLHEFGHFAFAKLFKTRVEKFYLFFNPWFTLFKFQKGETEYGLGWLPLGGYVKISGMIDESMDKEQMKQPPKPYEFRAKPAWQRLLIMLGGVMVNFVLALVIYAATLYIWGEQYLPTKEVKYGITADSLAKATGFQDGDLIRSVDGEEVENFFKIVPHIVLNDANSVQVLRDGQQTNVSIKREVIPSLLKDPAFITPRIPFYVAGFAEESPAKNAGIKIDDQIVAVNNHNTPYFDDFVEKVKKYKEQEVEVSVIRNQDTLVLPVRVNSEGMIGVAVDGNIARFFTLESTDYSLLESIPAGINKGVEIFGSYLKQLKLIFNTETEAYKSVGGFITIGNIFPGVWDWQSFWNLTAFLSIILAIMNVLPIPALDGGHVMFLLYEIVSGRKPSEKFLEYAQVAGMVLLLGLLVFANGNDIIKLFSN